MALNVPGGGAAAGVGTFGATGASETATIGQRGAPTGGNGPVRLSGPAASRPVSRGPCAGAAWRATSRAATGTAWAVAAGGDAACGGVACGGAAWAGPACAGTTWAAGRRTSDS